MKKTNVDRLAADEAMVKLTAWSENVKAAAASGARCANAFNMGLWYGEGAGLSKIPERDLDQNGDIADPEELLWFNMGAQWNAAWDEAEPLVQAALLKGLAILISSVISGLAAKK